MPWTSEQGQPRERSLSAEGVTPRPIRFKTHRQHYYELLNNVRLTGDWEAWLDFFAETELPGR